MGAAEECVAEAEASRAEVVNAAVAVSAAEAEALAAGAVLPLSMTAPNLKDSAAALHSLRAEAQATQYVRMI